MAKDDKAKKAAAAKKSATAKRAAVSAAPEPFWGSIEGELVAPGGVLSLGVGNLCPSLESLISAGGRKVEFRFELGDGAASSSNPADPRQDVINKLRDFLGNRNVIGITAKVTCCEAKPPPKPRPKP